MGKVTRWGGPSHAVPAPAIRNVLEKHAAGATLSEIAHYLNVSDIPSPDHEGVPRVGLWTREAVQELIDQNTP